MSSIPFRDGKAPFAVSSVDMECFTYYKVVGDVRCGTPPLVIMHGGPGVGHEYLLAFAELWPQYGIPVVFFDHLGCASSTRLPHTAGDKSFWTPNLSMAQLDSLLDYLDLRSGSGFDLLAHSFGGMIASGWAGARQPRGLRKLILAGTAASKELSMNGLRLRIEELPQEIQQAIYDGEKNEDYENDKYKEGINAWMGAFFCRTRPLPPEMVQANKNLAEDNTVFVTMSGPAFLKHTGSMLGFNSIPTLHCIDVPTLIYNGEHDTGHDVGQIPFFERIPRVRWATIAGGGHMCHLEGEGRKEKVLKLVGDFLTQGET